eukprot:CAMPEP_0172200806 /NCGR_PEP_ID=MMETSP1050-20130122/29573_1 /TAXON_ID=233186 /ORGANISM="Cryptomonas curvata, Strain CCAP979/52" /LENGTH=213 /DNA_ID=CAMNT_0012878231 /DNA_START=72 /DNA_END=710 /DNA_ORIENTATION=+
MTSKGSTICVDEAWDQAAPRRMMRELGLLQNLASDLIHTLSKCSLPLGFRQSSGSHIHTLIQKILEVNHELKVAEEDVSQHQERQRKVRSEIETVRYAEERIDMLVKDLQDIESELSLLIHRSKKTCMNTHSPKGGEDRVLDVEEVITYACHCSFTTSCGIRWFFSDGRPMHPPDQRDPRFLFPYPAAHSMRLQGGMWDHRSTRKPPPPEPQA